MDGFQVSKIVNQNVWSDAVKLAIFSEFYDGSPHEKVGLCVVVYDIGGLWMAKFLLWVAIPEVLCQLLSSLFIEIFALFLLLHFVIISNKFEVETCAGF